jgi:hypothetical protein
MDLMQLKKEKMLAMKDKDKNKVAALEAVISKVMLETINLRAKGKELTEADIIAVCQKVDRELEEEENANRSAGRSDAADDLAAQRKVVGAYLPQMLTDEEIRAVIMALADKSTPNVMKHFKAEYAGKVDMRKVSQILKDLQ